MASKALTVKGPSGSFTTADCPISISTNNESLSCTNPTKYQSRRSTVRKNLVSWEASFHLPKGKPFHTKRVNGQKMMINKKISTNSELNTEMFHHPCTLSNGLKMFLISKKKKRLRHNAYFS